MCEARVIIPALRPESNPRSIFRETCSPPGSRLTYHNFFVLNIGVLGSLDLAFRMLRERSWRRSRILWATEVAAAADLPDERLDTRLTLVIADAIERPLARSRASGVLARPRPPIALRQRPRGRGRIAPGLRHRHGTAMPRPGRDARGPGHDDVELHRVAHHPRTGPDRLGGWPRRHLHTAWPHRRADLGRG